jgi:hypothetical protein
MPELDMVPFPKYLHHGGGDNVGLDVGTRETDHNRQVLFPIFLLFFLKEFILLGLFSLASSGLSFGCYTELLLLRGLVIVDLLLPCGLVGGVLACPNGLQSLDGLVFCDAGSSKNSSSSSVFCAGVIGAQESIGVDK